MNAAFRRTDAMETLESFAPIVVLHVALLTCFPHSRDRKHWMKELEAFRKTYSRYNNGKRGRSNFNRELIGDSLEDVVYDFEGKERIVNAILAKGLSLEFEDVNWDDVRKGIDEFSRSVFRNTP